MGGKNMTAKIYLLEDINDNRYVGSTSEKILSSRLHTHRRDKKEVEFGVRKKGCSSGLLDLYHCNIILLEEVKNEKDIRNEREKHYINNVYTECVNTIRFNFDPKKFSKDYYAKNKNKIIERTIKWRNENREAYNAQRRKYYQKNKEKICQKRKEYRLKLKNKL
jgi:hypothetical protein